MKKSNKAVLQCINVLRLSLYAIIILSIPVAFLSRSSYVLDAVFWKGDGTPVVLQLIIEEVIGVLRTMGSQSIIVIRDPKLVDRHTADSEHLIDISIDKEEFAKVGQNQPEPADSITINLITDYTQYKNTEKTVAVISYNKLTRTLYITRTLALGVATTGNVIDLKPYLEPNAHSDVFGAIQPNSYTIGQMVKFRFAATRIDVADEKLLAEFAAKRINQLLSNDLVGAQADYITEQEIQTLIHTTYQETLQRWRSKLFWIWLTTFFGYMVFLYTVLFAWYERSLQREFTRLEIDNYVTLPAFPEFFKAVNLNSFTNDLLQKGLLAQSADKEKLASEQARQAEELSRKIEVEAEAERQKKLIDRASKPKLETTDTRVDPLDLAIKNLKAEYAASIKDSKVSEDALRLYDEALAKTEKIEQKRFLVRAVTAQKEFKKTLLKEQKEDEKGNLY